MADLIDAGNALRDAASAALYPQGTSQPSVLGVDVAVFVGWPLPAVLHDTLAAGRLLLSIYPLGQERNTTRYPPAWEALPAPACTLAASLSGQQITLAGVAAAGQVVGVQVQGRLYAYALQAGDSLGAAAAALLAEIQADYPQASISGAEITLPAAANVQSVKTGVLSPVLREVRRQQADFRMTLWSPSQPLREAAGQALDAAFAPLEFLPLKDGSRMRIIYNGASLSDDNEALVLYRRDLHYRVEYATTQAGTALPVLGGVINSGGNAVEAV